MEGGRLIEVGLYKVVVGYDVLDKSFQQFHWEILERIAVIQTRKEYIYQKLLCFLKLGGL